MGYLINFKKKSALKQNINLQNTKIYKIELFPLDRLVINDINIYLGKNKDQLKLLGEPNFVKKYPKELGGGFGYYFFNSNLYFECDNNLNIECVEIRRDDNNDDWKPIIYGISVFDTKMKDLYNALKKYNNGRINEDVESVDFLEISTAIWKDGGNDESDYWSCIDIGVKDCYLSYYEEGRIEDIIKQNQTIFENAFFGQVTDKEISRAEKKLGFKIPSPFVWFLKKYGSGGNHFDIIGYGKNGKIENVEETLEQRKNGLPKNFLIIENCDEFYYCIDITNGKIATWSQYDNDGLIYRFDNFYDYLNDNLDNAIENS